MAKDGFVKLRVSEDDATAMRDKASELGVSLSEFIRDCALNKPMPRRTSTLLLNDSADCIALSRAISIVAKAKMTADDEACYARLCDIAARVARLAPA